MIGDNAVGINLKLHDTQQAPSESDIASFEKQIGIQIPPSYRAFLLQHNGGIPEPSATKYRWRYEKERITEVTIF